jgi:amidase
MNELIKLTARAVVSLLKKREVSPLELIDVAEERIEAVEETVNAMPTLCFDRARDQARKLMANPFKAPPKHYLYGLPIVIKDLTDVKGVRTTYGSMAFSNHIPNRSDYLVETLEANGAIIIGKSNTPEFGAGGNTFNDVFGKTLNPWNTKMTCGGSSGGSAVALATGEAWLAAGSDLAGSLRTPASFCSVVGLRPSPGRVATGPNSLLYNTLGVQGPMARNISDVALMLDAQVGYHPGDPGSLPRPTTSYSDAIKKPINPRRIGYSFDLGITPVDSEVKEIFQKAINTWQNLNIPVEKACPDFKQTEVIFQTLRGQMFLDLWPLLDKYRHLFKPEVVWNIEKGKKLTAYDIHQAELKRAELYRSTLNFFKHYDLLICPSAILPPFDVNNRYPEALNGFNFENYVSWLNVTAAVTLTSCPSISVPCGFTKTGLPVGLQIVGPPRREDKLLAAASVFENAHKIDQKTPINPKHQDH